MLNNYIHGLWAVVIIFLITSCQDFLGADTDNKSIDTKIQEAVSKVDGGSMTDPPKHAEPITNLGQKLFFDKILSGNKDVSCATCHHPTTHTSDNLSLSIGVGGTGLGSMRQMGEGRTRVPRNALDVFNRGVSEWHSMFWDSRVNGNRDSGFVSPAGEQLPDGLNSLLAVQAMFPVTSRDEMRGEEGDLDVNGKINEIAQVEDGELTKIWSLLMDRLMNIPEYVALFNKAYPDIPKKDLHFKDAANALAAFQSDAYTFSNTPWDQYLSGDKQAISPIAKKGALLFYGKAKCSSCHGGTLLTDQKHHNIGIPQLGPGKGDDAPLDKGFSIISDVLKDEFCFRTPSLRNVTLTGPWMHNGAYTNLRDAVIHHLDPQNALLHYDSGQLEEGLIRTYQDDINPELIERLDPVLSDPIQLNSKEVDQIMAFLGTLTSPDAKDLTATIPDDVPSGLPLHNRN